MATDFRIDSSALTQLHEGELLALDTIAIEKCQTFPLFCGWLHAIVRAERNRRLDESSEPGMVAIPECSGHDLGEFLMAAHCFTKWPFPETTCEFLDAVERRAVCVAAAVLSSFEAQTI